MPARRASDQEDSQDTTLPLPTSTMETTCAPNYRVRSMRSLADGEDGKLDWWPLRHVLEGNLYEMFAW